MRKGTFNASDGEVYFIELRATGGVEYIIFSDTFTEPAPTDLLQVFLTRVGGLYTITITNLG